MTDRKAKFRLEDYELATVPVDRVDECIARWPDAPWLRFGARVVFYRRPRGVVLETFSAALREMLPVASHVTAAWVLRRDGIPDGTEFPGGKRAPLHGTAEPIGNGASAVLYRSYDGSLHGQRRIVMGSPDGSGKPVVMTAPPGWHPPETRS